MRRSQLSRHDGAADEFMDCLPKASVFTAGCVNSINVGVNISTSLNCDRDGVKYGRQLNGSADGVHWLYGYVHRKRDK